MLRTNQTPSPAATSEGSENVAGSFLPSTFPSLLLETSSVNVEAEAPL